MKTRSFDNWLKSHPCDAEILWHVQNCLKTVLGPDHPDAEAATQAWRLCRHAGQGAYKITEGANTGTAC